MPQRSAGILLYRRQQRGIEVLLVHPGGPFWAGKDDGAWSIPKGAYEPGEQPLAAARREFTEETGAQLEGEFDPAGLASNTFAMEWPPRSGRMGEFPEVDRAQWFTLDEAARKILKGQRAILQALLRHLGEEGGEGGGPSA